MGSRPGRTSRLSASSPALWRSARRYPQFGYPFRLGVVVTYSLTEQGLMISLDATNTGGLPAPFGQASIPA